MSDENAEQNAAKPIARGKSDHTRQSIREVRTYVDDGGREVRELVQMFGKNKTANIYKGHAVIQVRLAGPGGVPMPPRMQPFEFDIEAVGLKKAFELFDESAEAELEEMRKKNAEARKSVVGVGGPKSLVGADGKPIGG